MKAKLDGAHSDSERNLYFVPLRPMGPGALSRQPSGKEGTTRKEKGKCGVFTEVEGKVLK